MIALLIPINSVKFICEIIYYILIVVWSLDTPSTIVWTINLNPVNTLTIKE